MNNLTQSPPRSQQKDKKSLDYIGFLDHNYNQSCIPVIKLILDHLQSHPAMYYSQQQIALFSGVSYITARRAIKKLKDAGFIYSKSYGFNSSCVITLTEPVKDNSMISRLKRYFIGFMALGLLTVRGGGEQLLILKDNNLKSSTASQSVPVSLFIKNIPHLAQAVTSDFRIGYPQYDLGPSPVPLNPKLTILDFEALTQDFKRKERGMYTFTVEELQEIAQYPDKAKDHARKLMTNMMHQGKVIEYPFNWTIKVLQQWVKDNQPKKSLKREVSMVFNDPFSPEQIADKKNKIAAMEGRKLNPWEQIAYDAFKKHIAEFDRLSTSG